MGYGLWVMPLCEGEDPAERMRELVARAETGGSTPRQEARKQRLTELLISLEPRLGVFRRDPHALAEALPDLTEGQIAYLARTVELTGWPGIQIHVADEWLTVEIATWPELAEPEPVARLTRLVEALCADTGWACVNGETGVAGEPEACVHDAARGSARWGERVRELSAEKRDEARS